MIGCPNSLHSQRTTTQLAQDTYSLHVPEAAASAARLLQTSFSRRPSALDHNVRGGVAFDTLHAACRQAWAISSATF